MDCCNGSNKAGEWYFPNMKIVESIGEKDPNSMSFFSRNRGNRVVRLRRNRSPTERGLFYCLVPNANNVNQTIYVNIGR